MNIMANEEALRAQAVAMKARGNSVAEISRKLGRSRQWIYKWLDRHSEGAENWNSSRSRSPVHKAKRIAEPLERLVVETRLRLEASPYSESGAYAIWHDMSSHGITPPSVATINRIIGSHGLARRKIRYTKSDIDYPAVPLNTHMMDLIGPRHLRGGPRFFMLTVISNDSRHAGVYPILTKNSLDVTQSVAAFWKSFSVPDFLQMDNELSFKGSNRHPRGLGLLLRTALAFNVTPRFIPVGEPWRNGVIERFNQKVEKTLLSQEHASFNELLLHSREFTQVHNSEHHYSTLGHKTPLQLDQELDLPIVPLRGDYEVAERPKFDCSNRNEIHFIRLVRSDLTINVLNEEIEVPLELMHTYVEAILLVNDHQLQIRQDGRLMQTQEFIMPTE